MDTTLDSINISYSQLTLQDPIKRALNEKDDSAICIENVDSMPHDSIDHITTDDSSPHPPQTNKHNHSHLLSLPRELRDLIILFTISTPPLHASHLLPPLLQTSRQLRAETAPIYYSQHLILAGGAPSPKYEMHFFDKFDPEHKKYVKRVHWLYDSYGTREQAVERAGQLDRLSGLRRGCWTVGFIDGWGGKEGRRGVRARYVNSEGKERTMGCVD